MSRQRTAKEICERALRAIGAFPITDSAADGEQLREAMEWLDIIMAERAGVQRMFSLIPATLPILLTNGTTSYDLNSALGADLPVDRVQFPVEAWIEDAAGNRYPIEIATRETFEGVSKADTPGRPVMIYIDRLAVSPKLSIYPTPPTSDPTVWTIKLVVQTYAPNVSPGGVTGTTPSASVLTNFRQAWQRWLIFQLSHDLGSGPIFKLPETSLTRFAGNAKVSKDDLNAFENQEHDTEAPVCDDAFSDGDDCDNLPAARDRWSTLG